MSYNNTDTNNTEIGDTNLDSRMKNPAVVDGNARMVAKVPWSIGNAYGRKVAEVGPWNEGSPNRNKAQYPKGKQIFG